MSGTEKTFIWLSSLLLSTCIWGLIVFITFQGLGAFLKYLGGV